jgi:hypothetical protein
MKIELSDELQVRLALAEKLAGMTTSRFGLEAITEKTVRSERRADFFAIAEARFTEYVETGETIS